MSKLNERLKKLEKKLAEPIVILIISPSIKPTTEPFSGYDVHWSDGTSLLFTGKARKSLEVEIEAATKRLYPHKISIVRLCPCFGFLQP